MLRAVEHKGFAMKKDINIVEVNCLEDILGIKSWVQLYDIILIYFKVG